MLKRWTTNFKAMANVNRLKIITMLAKGQSMTVGQIAQELKISLKSTSKHLIMLHNLELLEYLGKDGHVYYSLNPNPPKDLQKTIKLFC